MQLVDRLAAPNTDQGYASYKAEFEGLALRLFGEGAAVERADADEPRRPLAVDLYGAKAEELDSLLARLERKCATASTPRPQRHDHNATTTKSRRK